MTKDEVQRSPSALPFGCELRAERLRAMSMSNGRWTFYEAVKPAGSGQAALYKIVKRSYCNPKGGAVSTLHFQPSSSVSHRARSK
ncbi:MAG: hypothetical protein JRJ65_10015 [Deltaproteobacteria bacterium]|nr:hypothetical protein [Deltaproteobacteria bacterium]